MRNPGLVGRVAAFAAVGIAIAAVAVILLSGGSSYQVKAVFANASQLVTGDEVQVSGNSIGSVSKITLTPNGKADLTLTINNSTFQPLHQGTQATVRLTSLSGIANRYVDLRMGSGTAPKIPNGGVIPTSNTTSAVDFDQIFNTLDGPTRKGLQNVIQGSASQYAGARRSRRSSRGSTSTRRSPRRACCLASSTATRASSRTSSSSRAISSRTSPSAARPT